MAGLRSLLPLRTGRLAQESLLRSGPRGPGRPRGAAQATGFGPAAALATESPQPGSSTTQSSKNQIQ